MSDQKSHDTESHRTEHWSRVSKFTYSKVLKNNDKFTLDQKSHSQMRHLLQLLLQWFYCIRNCLSFFWAGKNKHKHCVLHSNYFIRNAIICRCLTHIKCVFLADQQCRGLVLMITEPGRQSRRVGRRLKKEAVLFQSTSGGSGWPFLLVLSPGKRAELRKQTTAENSSLSTGKT